jgi:hypothetical protein
VTADTEILLDDGQVRQLHVSRQRIQAGNPRCLIIEQPEGRLYAGQIHIEGPSRLVYSKKKMPGGANVYVETRAPLRVFYPSES